LGGDRLLKKRGTKKEMGKVNFYADEEKENTFPTLKTKPKKERREERGGEFGRQR